MGEWKANDWDTGIISTAPAESMRRDRAYLIVLAGDNLGEMHAVAEGETIIGRADTAAVVLRDDGVSRHHVRLRRDDGRLTLEDLGSRNGTFVNGLRVSAPMPLLEGDKIQIGHRTVLRLAYHDELDDSFQRRLYEAAMYDTLTGAHSRRYFLERVEAELHFSQRHGAPLAVVLFDLDRLKEVNDRYGHAAGDRLLVEVARTVHVHVRAEDLFGRMGGDEFGIVCRATPMAEVATFAERMRGLVEALIIDIGGAHIQATLSLGIAVYPEVAAQSAAELIAAADHALYAAKRRGRNQVAVHHEEAEETRQVPKIAAEQPRD